MKLLVFAVCALACLTLANTKPCRGSKCGGYQYNDKHQTSDVGGYNSQVGSHAAYASSNANAVDGSDSVDRNDSVGISRDSGDRWKERGVGTNGGDGGLNGGGGGINGGGGMYGVWGMYGGDGRYYDYNGYQRNYYCPTCHVESIGNGGEILNIINIERKPKPTKQELIVT